MSNPRNIKRIDYSILNSTGQRVEKSQVSNLEDSINNSVNTVIQESSILNWSIDQSIMSTKDDDIKKLDVEQSVIYDEIKDFIDENPVYDMTGDENGIKENLINIEELRRKYRAIHKTLESMLGEYYDTSFSKSSALILAEIKDYIKSMKYAKSKLTNEAQQLRATTMEHKENSIKFVIGNIKQTMDELDVVFIQDVKKMNDDELLSAKKESATHVKSMDSVTQNYQDVLAFPSKNESILTDVNNLNKRYEILSHLKIEFLKNLNKEMTERDLEKYNKFKESSLNIKLTKFIGYESECDIYTFKAEFEKLYLRTVPSKMLPDLLKNNLLGEPAVSLVKNEDDINIIWDQLQVAYGDPKTLLINKLSKIKHLDSIWKFKDSSKIIAALSKIKNLMKDLMKISKRHDIEKKLYNGDAFNQILSIIGDKRMTRWIAETCNDNLEDERLWETFMLFLDKDIKVNQQKIILKGCESRRDKTPYGQQRGTPSSVHYSNNGEQAEDDVHSKHRYDKSTGEGMNSVCVVCGASDHISTPGPWGKKIVQYFSCQKFTEKTPAERFAFLMEKRYCFQCLLPGADKSEGKHKEGKCQREFACKHKSHDRYPLKKHVLVCNEHKDHQENIKLLDEYKNRCILRNKLLPAYSRDIKLTFHTTSESYGYKQINRGNDENIIADKAIYQLQEIKVGDQCYTIFYDTGCEDFITRHSATQRLGSRAVQEFDGQVSLGGVGETSTQSQHGIYSIHLPLFNGRNALMTGICLDKITSTFPWYPIEGKVQKDIFDQYQKTGGSINSLPKLPKMIGGDIDFMIGIKYLRYHPEVIFQLTSGLTIYKSLFNNASGGRGVIGGPHEVFTRIEQHLGETNKNFITQQYKLYQDGYHVNPDLCMSTNKDYDIQSKSNLQSETYITSKLKSFKLFEETGCEITYRCPTCRSCKECKNHEKTDAISIKEEVEQDMINNSVTVDVKTCNTIASLPFIYDPSKRLVPNKHKALKVFNQQLKKLNKNEKDKEDVLKSERKLQELGHVEYMQNLPPDIQQMLKNHQIQNFIPWRTVWKETSISTPCRMVFDGSQPTSSGFSLNDLLAKGRNNMNKLQEILIRWMIHKVGIQTDIQKMYNTVKLRKEDWCYQRYIWQENLDPNKIPEEKIIKTLIYGVKSSGNQSEFGLRETARLSCLDYPEVHDIVCNDTYVDDCLTGEESEELALQRADEIDKVLQRGGFKLKGISFSGKIPPSSLSDDGETINVAGMKWFPKEDLIALDVKDLNFNKKVRGRKSDHINGIPNTLTRRQCVSKVGEIYDLTGKITPITAAMKLDLHDLVSLQLNWDDKIPDEFMSTWINNFNIMYQLKDLRYKRVIVPEDAVNLDVSLVCIGDASKYLACAVVYARFKRKNGEYSCQHVLGRSKIIPDGTTQPRAEMIAAVLNVHTAEVVKKSFKKWYTSSIYLTDSQIVLHWISNDIQLKQWVRNRVIEIQRFTQPKQWSYVQTNDMVADIGTRKGSTIKDVDQTSPWICGFLWMQKAIEEFPMKSVKEINLSSQQMESIKTETPYNNINSVFYSNSENNDVKNLEELIKRYKFSSYLVDPNRHRFKTIIRITAIVIRFCSKLLQRIGKRHHQKYKEICSKYKIILLNEEIAAARKYYFNKSTQELLRFVPKHKYQHITKEKDGILMYTGRILPDDKTTVVGKFTDVMKDLTSASFCVPVIDKESPVAFSIVNEVHWYCDDAKHSGVETVLRYVEKEAHIIEGRSLVKRIRKNCQRCRYLMKQSIEVSMGPISKYKLTIAPAFYITQVDLCGPFKAYSPQNKRKTSKIWLTVFCCLTTSTTSIKVMDDYSSSAFIQAFTRFSCDVGYPKVLLPDEGSQLIKSCEDARLNFNDIKFKLHVDVGVEFETCPVGAHNFHGKVERKIQQIKKSIQKIVINERLSLMQWETISALIANSVNNLPLALGNLKADLDTLDLITPNRLKLGRNNNRSPASNLQICKNPGRIIQENDRIFNIWFDNWLLVHVPKLMQQGKWFKTTQQIKEGDIVLFLKQDSSIMKTYQYGKIKSVSHGRDSLIRKATVVYRNHTENVNPETTRSIRDLVIIKYST